MKYVIPEIPNSNNKYIGRSNIYEYQQDKKTWCDLIWAYCRPRPDKPLDKAIVSITYHFKDNIRRDPDNYSGKMILDGLTKNGIIKDDSFLCIKLVLGAKFGCERKETIIEVTEYDGAGD